MAEKHSQNFITGETKVPGESEMEKIIKSPLVRHINISVLGLIDQIQNRTLVISEKGETLSILIKEDAHIFMLEAHPMSLGQPHPQNPLDQEKIDLKRLKIGDRVSILASLSLNGSLIGSRVTLIVFSR